MAKVPIFPRVDWNIEIAKVGGSADLILGRPVLSSEVAGDITAMTADGMARVVIATTDAKPCKGIAIGIPGQDYEVDNNGHYIASVGDDVYIVRDGSEVMLEIGDTIDTTSADYLLYLSPGTNGCVKSVDTAAAKHFHVARLKNSGTYAAGDVVQAIVDIGIVPTAPAA